MLLACAKYTLESFTEPGRGPSGKLPWVHIDPHGTAFPKCSLRFRATVCIYRQKTSPLLRREGSVEPRLTNASITTNIYAIMAWLNQNNAYSEKDLDLFDLQPGEKCNIQAITWSRAENVRMKELCVSAQG